MPEQVKGRLSKGAFVGHTIANYQPTLTQFLFHPAIREGRLVWQDVPAMLMDPTIRIGLQTLAAPYGSVEWKIQANSPEIAHFVDSTMQQFWQDDMRDVVRMYHTWGTVPGEANYTPERRGLMTFDNLDLVYPFDTRARFRSRKKVETFTVSGAYNRAPIPAHNWIMPPKMFWCSHEPEIGTPYGRSKLSSAWSAWMEKCGAKGAKDARRLFFFKCAFHGGMILFEPGGSFVDESGTVHQNEDYARELVEKMETGAVIAIPSVVDEHGNRMWEYIPPAAASSVPQLLEYPEKLDAEILMGMGVFPELIRAMETGGGWSGRQVPLIIFLASTDADVQCIINRFDQCVIRPLVNFNFGEKAKYRIKPQSLVPKPPPAEGAPGGAPGQPGQPQPGQPQEAQASAGDAGKPGASQGLMGATQQQRPAGGAPIQMSALSPLAALLGAPEPVTDVVKVVALPATACEGFVPVPDEMLDLLLGCAPVAMSTDPSGHEHKSSGEGGGQFTVHGGAVAEPAEQSGQGKPPAPEQQAQPRRRRAIDNVPKIDPLNIAHRPIFDQATPEQRNAVHLYQNTPVYRHIQEGLRGKAQGGIAGFYHGLTMGKQAKQAVGHLDTLMGKSSLPATTLHRALILPEAGEDLKKLHGMVGKTVSDPAFASTSTDPDSIEQFMTMANRVRAEISVPEGARGLSLHPDATGMPTKWAQEKEVLLPRESRFKIREVVQDPDGRYRVRMELQPHQEAGAPTEQGVGMSAAEGHEHGEEHEDRSHRYCWHPDDWRVVDEKPVAMSTDASGNEHKGKGEGGGQFASKGAGGAGESKEATPEHAESVLYVDHLEKAEKEGTKRLRGLFEESGVEFGKYGIEVSDYDAKRIKRTVVHDIASRMEVDDESVQAFIRPFGENALTANMTPKEKAAHFLVKTWAKTSGDHDDLANAVQNRANALFGLKDTHVSLGGWLGLDAKAEAAKHQKVIDAYLQATYEATQEFLEASKVENVTLYRGMTVPDRRTEAEAAQGAPDKMKLQPLSSFSAEFSTAAQFTADGEGQKIVMACVVPRRQIFSIAIAGPGCVQETEAIVFGGTVPCAAADYTAKAEDDVPVVYETKERFYQRLRQRKRS